MYVSFLIDNIYVISNLKIPKIMTFLSLKKKKWENLIKISETVIKH